MALFQSKAVTELERLRKELAKLQERIDANQQDLAVLRNVSDEALLDQLLAAGAESRNQTHQRVRELEDVAEDLRRAQRALLERIRQAQRAVNHERAEKIRAEAAKLQAELDQHSAKTAELKKALELHAGEPYFPQPGWMLNVGDSIPEAAFTPAVKMQMEIAKLRAEADRIEAGEPEGNVLSIQPIAQPPLAPALQAPPILISEPTPLIAPPRGWYPAV